MSRALLLLVAIAGGIAAAQQPQQQPTFRASVDFVSVDVAVRLKGRPVTGLKIDEFEILDNGVPQQVADFSYEKQPIDVTVALDISESVSGRLLEQLRRAVQQLRADLGTRDRLKLMTFNMRVQRLTDFADPAPAASAAFDGIKAFGSSGIFDTLAVALSSAIAPDRRQLIVIFSDGHDTSSITDPATLLDVARRTTPTVHVVLPPVPIATGGPGVVMFQNQLLLSSRQVYTALARETGGVVVTVSPGENLTSTFRRVLDDFRSSYVLHFSPTGVARQGVHTLDVKVKRSGVEVRARREYDWR